MKSSTYVASGAAADKSDVAKSIGMTCTVDTRGDYVGSTETGSRGAVSKAYGDARVAMETCGWPVFICDDSVSDVTACLRSGESPGCVSYCCTEIVGKVVA